MTTPSPFLDARRTYAPKLPEALRDLTRLIPQDGTPLVLQSELAARFPRLAEGKAMNLIPSKEAGRTLPPLRVAAVLSGGPAPGGHNVLWGLAEGLEQLAPGSLLIGFECGPGGILADKSKELPLSALAPYHNTGGFDLIGTGRTKLETPEQFAQCRAVLERHRISALVIIGGDDSNTNAAALAEYFAATGAGIKVLGVPKTIDGDLKNEDVEASFGFDTAVKVYAELIANISRDVLSTRKYFHFIRLMGRSASHITLEAALATQPNIALISEEVAARGLTLAELVKELGTVVKARAADGKNFGVVLVPEGLVEFVPEMRTLIYELNHVLHEEAAVIKKLAGFSAQAEFVHGKLSDAVSKTFSTLPVSIQRQLLMERDPHGNVVVSRIETEKLLIELLELHLAEESAHGRYVGRFAWQHHFLGYEGRAAAPSNFDADYAYALGRTAAALAGHGANGLMAVVANLAAARSLWQPRGVPLAGMMTMEARHGKMKPVIKKCLVGLDSGAFAEFARQRAAWASSEDYIFTGPLQYFGPAELTDAPPRTLTIDSLRRAFGPTNKRNSHGSD